MKKFNVKLKDKDGNYIYPYTRVDQVEGIEDINVLSSTKLRTEQTIDGIKFNGEASISRYAVCSTEANSSEKKANIKNFELIVGAKVIIMFENKNTAEISSLNINDTGSFPIRYKGSNVSAGLLESKFPYSLIFSGESWEISGGAPIDTSVMTIKYW